MELCLNDRPVRFHDGLYHGRDLSIAVGVPPSALSQYRGVPKKERRIVGGSAWLTEAGAIALMARRWKTGGERVARDLGMGDRVRAVAEAEAERLRCAKARSNKVSNAPHAKHMRNYQLRKRLKRQAKRMADWPNCKICGQPPRPEDAYYKRRGFVHAECVPKPEALRQIRRRSAEKARRYYRKSRRISVSQNELIEVTAAGHLVWAIAHNESLWFRGIDLKDAAGCPKGKHVQYPEVPEIGRLWAIVRSDNRQTQNLFLSRDGARALLSDKPWPRSQAVLADLP